MRGNRIVRAAVAAFVLWTGGMAAWDSTLAAGSVRPALRPEHAGRLVGLEQIPRWMAPYVDVVALRAEDLANAGKAMPYRVGFPMTVDITPSGAGTWEELGDGARLWRYRVQSPGALWMVLGFTRFDLPAGAELYAYPAQGTPGHGPYGSADVRAHRELWLAPLESDDVVLELYWPAALRDKGVALTLGIVSHGYKPWGSFGRINDAPEPDAGSCNIDVNCPLGSNWQDAKRGVVNLLSGGSGYCSGSLITNTAQDCKNYVLTANHCLSTSNSATSTQFQFNFERPSCNSGSAPTGQVLTGSFLRSTFSGSDFTLLEMDDPIPESYRAFYNGWSRSTTAASESWAIHHPNNDEKKISYDDDPLTNGTNWGPTHWRVGNYEQGTTEPGSSGSPLFNGQKQIIGQLHGGSASCTSITYDEYGKVDRSWTGNGTNSTRLSNWLDPGASGVVTQAGIDATTCAVPKPRLEYLASVIDDSAPVGGNGNGVVDPGETYRIQVTAANNGNQDASNVAGTLSTTTPLVSITDSSAAWPNIPLAQSRPSIAPHFTVVSDGALACGALIQHKLVMTATQSPGSWESNFTVRVGSPSTTPVFSDGMESGVGGWTNQTLEGTLAWARSTAQSSSPVTSWFVTDPSSRQAAALNMQMLPGLVANAKLRFKHRFSLEQSWDGGVLEYSTNGGANWSDAGPLMTLGSYSGVINSGADSGLAGRSAWTGSSGGAFLDVEVDLSSLAGQNVRLRWLFASDGSVSDEGWYIDDVIVDATVYTCTPPVLLPGEASAPSGSGAPFTIAKGVGGSYLLAWSAPPSGGTVERYKLYRTTLAGPITPQCEADLGSGTSASLSSLTSNRGFLVVAKNAAGEGSYGSTSGGTPRSKAGVGDACP